MIMSNQVFYRTPQLEILTEDEREMIFSAALEILERTGMKIEHKEGLSLLGKAGACIEGKIAHIPSYMIKEALRTAPSKILIYNRDGEPAMRLEGFHYYFGTGSDCPNILDSFTGEIRHFTRADIAKGAVIADALPHIDFLMSMGLISDKRVHVTDLYQFQEMVFNSPKPIIFTSHGQRGNEDIIRMASIVAGGEEELRRKPFIIHYIEPTSPLKTSKEAIDTLLLTSEKGIPLIYTPCAAAGATSPATLAGTLAQTLAESLSGLVISQLRNKGAPVILGGVITAMDMKTTAYLYGGPEFHLMSAALAEMAHYLNMPVFGTAGCSDSKVVDEQAAIEATLSIALQTLSGANLIHDVGYLGSGLIGSFDMLVMSNEVIGMAKRIMRGIEIDEEHLVLDVIHNVGPKGDFLSERHTLEHFKAEHWHPELLDRQSYDKWAKGGHKSLGERVNEKTRAILEEHKPKPLGREKQDQILELLAART